MIVAPVALTLACGQPNQKVDLQNSLLSDSADPNCKPGACPEVAYALVDGAGKSLDSASQSGAVGKVFAWSVKVKSSAPSSRLKIAVVQKAQWMQAANSTSDGGGVDISGNPTESVSQNAVVIWPVIWDAAPQWRKCQKTVQVPISHLINMIRNFR